MEPHAVALSEPGRERELGAERDLAGESGGKGVERVHPGTALHGTQPNRGGSGHSDGVFDAESAERSDARGWI